MGKKWLVGCLVFTMMLALTMVGCKDDKSTNDDGDELAAEFVGTWVFQTVTIDDDEASISEYLEWNEGAVIAMLIIESNGDCTYQENDESGNSVWNSYGEFAVDGDNLTLTFTSDSDGELNPPDVTTGTVDVSDSTMVVTQEDDGVTVVTTLMKVADN